MAQDQDILVNTTLAFQDIEKINFLSQLRQDPVKYEQYRQERVDKQLKETMERKRAGFQKAYYDMGRYIDMDHHARFYETRNENLDHAQKNLISFVEANSHALRYDIDNTRRQFLVNDWYASNKLESLFFLQVAFLAAVSSLLVLMLGRLGVFPGLLPKYLVFIIASIAAITGISRFYYTKYIRDTRYWSKRKFDFNPGNLHPKKVCIDLGNNMDAASAATAQQQSMLNALQNGSVPSTTENFTSCMERRN